MKEIFVIALIALSTLFSTTVLAQRKAPAVVFTAADGKTYDLAKLQGKVVVVNFWATWCPPCRREIPDFIDVYKSYKDKGVVIIGASVDQDGWAAVTPFVKKNNINYPVALDDGTIARKFSNFNAIPTTFIIDKSGTIVDEHTGVMTKSQLETKLKALLSPNS